MSQPTQALSALQRRLTAWYAVTLTSIMLLLCGSLFTVLSRNLSDELDLSLQLATEEVIRAARIREQEAGAVGYVADALLELRIPNIELYLLDARAEPVVPDQVPEWVREAARQTPVARIVHHYQRTPVRLDSRLRAQRFRLDHGRPMIAVAVADEAELEVHYLWLISVFGIAGVSAAALLAIGGTILVRQSMSPVIRSLTQLRKFSADASHELRSPLALIRSHADVALQRPRSPEEYEQTLRRIEGESRRLSRIVEEMLLLSRVEAGDRVLAMERVFLDDLAADAVESVRDVARAREQRLEITEFVEAAVRGDEAALRQLVVILLDNATKFTAKGGRIAVRVGRDDATVRLEVEDTGCGIAPDQLPFIFDRFFRGDPARRRLDSSSLEGGAGLGLSIAHAIAEAHGATIDVRSTVGIGSTFVVRVPAYR
ncbi:MAG: HAMP domain-containing sensor histidine kinase [Gemmatimonadaceae bacterium]|nr:HAMP domain-containing sensor histidine kinase [Gemmatimonadaceae bacterium]